MRWNRWLSLSKLKRIFKDIPIDYFGKKDLFPKSLHVATPYVIVWDDIMKEAIKNEQT